MNQTIEFDRLVKQIAGGEWRVPVEVGNSTRQTLLSRPVDGLREYVEALTTCLVEQALVHGDPINRAAVGEVVWGMNQNLSGLFHADLARVWQQTPAAEQRLRRKMAAYGLEDFPEFWESVASAIERGEMTTLGQKAKYPEYIQWPPATDLEREFWSRSSVDGIPTRGASEAWVKSRMDPARKRRVERDRQHRASWQLLIKQREGKAVPAHKPVNWVQVVAPEVVEASVASFGTLFHDLDAEMAEAMAVEARAKAAEAKARAKETSMERAYRRGEQARRDKGE